MKIKKTVAIAAAVGAFAAISVPAMAFENEFHGMYKFMGYQTNFFNGVAAGLSANPESGFMAEQRARLQYSAKVNTDLKLVTHFELDSRFGGRGGNTASNTYTAKGDAGKLDADALSLETKNVYIDFNCPITGVNAKVGLQPWADSYQSLFLQADMTGVYATRNFGPAKASLGWFRLDDSTTAAAQVGQLTADLIVVDGKYTISKDLKVGVSYYNIQNDTSTTTPAYELLHMFGVNADIKAGPADIKPFAAFQIGDRKDNTDLNGFLLGAVSKIKVGPGAVNLSAIYISGDSNGTTKEKSFTAVTTGTTYFVPAKMWLLVRNGQGINTSTSVLGNDLTVGGRGLVGVFGGYEGAMGKMFYNANVGYTQTAEKRNSEKNDIGTEINAEVGYMLLDNLKASAALAYAMLGDGMNSNSAASRISGFGVANADDPYALNLQLSYTF